jgi:hypothetical protein
MRRPSTPGDREPWLDKIEKLGGRQPPPTPLDQRRSARNRAPWQDRERDTRERHLKQASTSGDAVTLEGTWHYR